MTSIKMCGITNEEDAGCAVACGVDALGFIFYPGSSRYIDPAAAKKIMAGLPRSVARVGVFVNQAVDEVLGIADQCRLDFIQLHGDESPAYCLYFDPSRLIKAVTSAVAGDSTQLTEYAVKAFLVDARDGDRYGGTGKVSDWNLAAALAARYRLILAGGLNEDNIIEAIARVSPDAVDINSGVEIAPGRKDHEKMGRIVRMIRANEGSCDDEAGVFREES
jgi:phosphoribosylanthranilate isomerase